MLNARLVKAAVVGITVMGLAACSNHYKPLDASQGGTEGSDQGQTYGLQNGAGFNGQGQKDQYGRFINPLVAPANQTYYFDFDQSGVHQSDMKAISIQANYLASHPKAVIRLEGNTDNRGSREYNIGLGWRRDQAVARIFEQQGVSPKQIHMVSYGKEKPAAAGDNESAWMLNRRVNLIYEAY
jgi:peptidoglycan-associated lipoprotein